MYRKTAKRSILVQKTGYRGNVLKLYKQKGQLVDKTTDGGNCRLLPFYYHFTTIKK